MTVQEQLNSLNPQQLQKVYKLIAKLAAKNDKPQQPLTLPTHAKKQPKVVKKGGPKMPSTKKGGSDDLFNEIDDEPSPPIAKQRKPIVGKKQNIKGRTDKGVSTRNLGPVEIGAERPNLFDSIKFSVAERKALAADAALDKKLVNTISERRGSDLIEVECIDCGRANVVSKKVVYSDSEGVRYKCDKCAGKASA